MQNKLLFINSCIKKNEELIFVFLLSMFSIVFLVYGSLLYNDILKILSDFTNYNYYGVQEAQKFRKGTFLIIFLDVIISVGLYLLYFCSTKYRTNLKKIVLFLVFCLFIICFKYIVLAQFISFIFFSYIFGVLYKNAKFNNNFYEKEIKNFNNRIYIKIFPIITIVFLISLVLYLSIYFYHLDTFHISEMNLFSSFYSIKDLDSVTIRHGLYELLIQKFILLFTDDYILLAHILIFSIKYFSIIGIILVSYLYYTQYKNLLLIIAILVFFNLSTIAPSKFAEYIIPIFLLLLLFINSESKKAQYSFILGFLSISIFFLRIDIGIFIFVALLFIFLFTSIKFFSIYTLGCLSSFLVFSLFFGFGFIENYFVNSFYLQLKYNGIVWGNSYLNIINATWYNGKVIIQYMFTMLGIFLFIKNYREHRDKLLPYLFLILISLFTFKFFSARIDSNRLMYFSTFLVFLPFVIFFIHSARKKIIFTIFTISIMLLYSSYTNNYRNGAIKFISFFEKSLLPAVKNNNFSLYQYNDMWDLRVVEKYEKLINNNRNKVSFFTFSPFLYTYFNTKPVGRYTDSFQVYPLINNKTFENIIDKSSYIFWIDKTLDGVPNKKRLKYQLDYINKKFIKYKIDGRLTIYKNKELK